MKKQGNTKNKKNAQLQKTSTESKAISKNKSKNKNKNKNKSKFKNVPPPKVLQTTPDKTLTPSPKKSKNKKKKPAAAKSEEEKKPVNSDDEEMECDEELNFSREKEREKLLEKYVEEFSATAEDPKLPPKMIKILETVIAYIYRRDNTIAVKMSFEESGIYFDSKYDEQKKTFTFLLDNKAIVTTTGEQTEALKEARQKLFNYLRYYCYTIKRCRDYYTTKPVVERKIDDGDKVKTFENRAIGEESVGFKMMESMGWKSGETLGKEENENGLAQPVGLNIKKGKTGLGEEPQKAKNIPIEELKEKIEKYAKRTTHLYDLVFSASFTNAELNLLKNHATHLKLFPQMIASNNNNKKKRLVISKNLKLKEIKDYLEADNADLRNKYILIPPMKQHLAK